MRKPRWTKIYLIIIWCFTLVAILVGISRMTGHWSISVGPKVEETMTFEKEYARDSLSEIVIDADAANLRFLYGDTVKVEYNYPKKGVPEVEYKDGKLEITEKLTKSFSSLFHKKYDLIITIPRDVELDSLNIDVDMGDIEFGNIKSDSLTINADMGNVQLSDITTEKAEFALSMGNLEIASSKLGSVEAKCDMGNIEIDAFIDEIEADCDMGNIEIKTHGDVDLNKFNLHCDLGNVEVDGTKWKNK